MGHLRPRIDPFWLVGPSFDPFSLDCWWIGSLRGPVALLFPLFLCFFLCPCFFRSHVSLPGHTLYRVLILRTCLLSVTHGHGSSVFREWPMSPGLVCSPSQCQAVLVLQETCHSCSRPNGYGARLTLARPPTSAFIYYFVVYKQRARVRVFP